MNRHWNILVLLAWAGVAMTAMGASRFDAPAPGETPSPAITVDVAERPPFSGSDAPLPEGSEEDIATPDHPDHSEMAATAAAVVQPAPEIASDAESVADYRDPFWPTGYIPKRLRISRSAATAAREFNPLLPNWDEARKRLYVRGVSRVGLGRDGIEARYLGMVNGRWVEAGDIVSVRYEGNVYRWQIRAIDAQGLRLIRLNVTSEAED